MRYASFSLVQGLETHYLFHWPWFKCDPNWYNWTVVTFHVIGAPVHAMLLEERSGHYSEAVTDIDRHMHWHATNAGSTQWKREEGRTQYQWLFTVATITAPSIQTHTSRQSHQANASASEDPAWVREHFPRDISDVHVRANTLTSTDRQTHTHKLMSCQSLLVFIVFISFACLFYQSILREPTVVQWNPRRLRVLRLLCSIRVSGCPKHK